MVRDLDERLVAKVMDAWLRCPAVDATGISVAVVDGVAHLTGAVHSHSERLEALDIAAAVDGVTHVDNAITVLPVGTHWQLSDDQVVTNVAAELLRADVPVDGIEFHVKNHVVVLSGCVPSEADRSLIRHAVQNADGADFVDNRIVVDRS